MFWSLALAVACKDGVQVLEKRSSKHPLSITWHIMVIILEDRRDCGEARKHFSTSRLFRGSTPYKQILVENRPLTELLGAVGYTSLVESRLSARRPRTHARATSTYYTLESAGTNWNLSSTTMLHALPQIEAVAHGDTPSSSRNESPRGVRVTSRAQPLLRRCDVTRHEDSYQAQTCRIRSRGGHATYVGSDGGY